MGAGASVDGPSQHASITDASFDIYASMTVIGSDSHLSSTVNEIANKISSVVREDDKILKAERKNMFRQHQKIVIPTICKRNKHMLGMLTRSDEVAYPIKNQDAFKVGGNYGTYLTFLSQTRAEIDFAHMEYATSGLGCDEMSMGYILSGLCTPSDLIALDKLYVKNKSMSLVDKIIKSMSASSASRAFFLSILNATNRPAGSLDGEESDSAVQAHTQRISELLNNKKMSESQENEIFKILTANSRDHCTMIMENFAKSSTDLALHKLLIRHFSAPCANSMILYMMKPEHAVAKIVIDIAQAGKSFSLVYVLSRFDKMFFQAVNASVKMKTGKLIADYIKTQSNPPTGNYFRAIAAWLEDASGTPDGGKMEELQQIVASHHMTISSGNSGSSLSDAMQNPSSEMFGIVKSHLDQCNANLADFLGMQRPVVDDVKDDRADETMDTDAVSDKQNRFKLKPQSSRAKFTITESVQAQEAPSHKKELQVVEEDYETKLKVITDYLTLHFENNDADGSGVLETEEFWKLMKDLRLEQIGFTSEEVDAMQSWCDWDADGEISYEECVGELADAILQQIEGNMKDGDSVSSIIHKLESQIGEYQSEKALNRKKQSQANQETRKGGSGAYVVKDNEGEDEKKQAATSTLPPLLLTYLTDTFEAYDIDKNGELDEDEFFQMVRVLNLGLNDDNIDNIRNKFREWDTSKDGKIAWSEALPKFNDLLHSMCDKKEDKWIGLADKANGNQLFWYNLKNETSQWMSAEDQEAFMANPYHVPPAKSGRAKGKK